MGEVIVRLNLSSYYGATCLSAQAPHACTYELNCGALGLAREVGLGWPGISKVQVGPFFYDEKLSVLLSWGESEGLCILV